MQACKTFNIDRTYGHIDLSTGDTGMHVVRKFALKTRIPDHLEIERPMEWEFAWSFPLTVVEALTSEDWDLVLERLQTRPSGGYSAIEMIVATAWAMGVPTEALLHKVGMTVAENLYRRFCERQIEAGNKAWIAPSSMQRVSNPNG